MLKCVYGNANVQGVSDTQLGFPGPDGKHNHERVCRIGEALNRKGVPVWIDTQRMTGSIVKQMCKGIDDSECV